MIKKITSAFLAFVMIFCFAGCGNKSFEEKGDYLTGNKWEGSDASLLELNTDGTHKFYNSSSDLSNNYYKGEFTVLNGQDAIDYLDENYAFTEEGQRKVMMQYGVEDEFYYVLILKNKERIIGGKNDLGQETKVEYFGYYTASDKHLNFTSLKTMAQMDFYKK